MFNIIEKFVSIDGEGPSAGELATFIRFQGCNLRCAWCDTTYSFDKSEITEVLSAEEIYSYIKETGVSNVTLTGGEPLLQIDFVTELFKIAKAHGIHTALDTSGITFNPENTENINNLLKYTDLVLLDIKHIDDAEHKKLTGASNKNILAFAQYLSEKQIPVWIRHVVVKDITLNEKYLKELGRFLKTMKNIKALDILPYHNMAIPKYEALGINYPLKNTPPTTKEEAIWARDIILQNMR